MPGAAPSLFLDEIHRFNKAQDALLPAVEEGLVTLIGATTENPYFEVNSALLSRCQIYELHGSRPDDVAALLLRALADPQHGSPTRPRVAEEARTTRDAVGRRRAHRVERLGARSRARARSARWTSPRPRDALRRRAVSYDREGDLHYDYISAWIKATRGSDADARRSTTSP